MLEILRCKRLMELLAPNGSKQRGAANGTGDKPRERCQEFYFGACPHGWGEVGCVKLFCVSVYFSSF